MARRKGSSATLRGVLPKDFTLLSFGEALRALRIQKSLSQTALAQALDRSTSFISLIESDQRTPSREFVGKIIEALDLEESSEEATTLLRAAGFNPGEISKIITRLVAAVGAEVQMGESQRLRLTADLTAQVDAWKAHLEAQRDLVVGKIDEVKARCDEALKLPYLSPTLRVSTLLTRADAEVHQGALADAELSAEAAAQAIAEHTVVPAWEPIANAELLALHGMIALDLVSYAQSERYLEQAISAYQLLLSTGVGAYDEIAFIGIGLSYKRFAELTMLQGDPVKASTFCVAAETYLLRAPSSEERERWRRRNREQMAWIASAQHEFGKAISLRQQTREELGNAGDTYGLIRNQLYTGNDYLSHINDVVRRALPDLPAGKRRASDKIIARVNATNETLRDEDIQRYLKNAEGDYRDALTGLKKYDHKMLLSLCLSKLANILRYKAILDDSPQPDTKASPSADESSQPDTRLRPSQEARALLTQALTIENSLKRPRRIAAIYEALADLEIDSAFGRGSDARPVKAGSLNDSQRLHLNDARAYIRQGLSQLGDFSPFALSGVVADAQRERLSETANSLKAWLDETTPGMEEEHAGASREANAVTPEEREWQNLCVKLLAIVRRLIKEQGASVPDATSNRDDKWNERIRAVERKAGGRLIIQNGLSDGLAESVRAGFSVTGAETHRDRFHDFSRAVKNALTPNDQARDLCCRKQVEHDWSEASTALLTRMQIKQALDWMENYPNGYALESSALPVPLNVYVKGASILLEIPQDVAETILDLRPKQETHDESLCYEFTDKDRANELRALFEEFVTLAEKIRSKEPNNESTKNWLRRLSEPTRKAPEARRTSFWLALTQAVKDTAVTI